MGAAKISIHAPHEGERPRKRVTCVPDAKTFQSTLPTRGSDAKTIMTLSADGYFNPRSPRGGATRLYNGEFEDKAISIHAPHEGERLSQHVKRVLARMISIHAPHEGERQHAPLRRRKFLYDFNPRSPRGGATVLPHSRPLGRGIISIHAPHEGERRFRKWKKATPKIFQSTLPTRGSDGPNSSTVAVCPQISIHAPHEGERLINLPAGVYANGISIHAPHEGERRVVGRALH